MNKTYWTAALAAMALGATPVFAAVTVYTSESDFDAAITSAATYDFTGIAPAGGYVVESPTVAGVTFTDTNIPFVIDNGSNPVYGVPFFSGQGSVTGPNDVGIALSGYQAIGFNYGSYIASSDPYAVTLNTGDVTDIVTAPTTGTLQFLGFVSDAAPITLIDLLDTGMTSMDNGFGYAFDITNFTLGNPVPAAVPEPSSWALMLVGFAVVGGALRKSGRTLLPARG